MLDIQFAAAKVNKYASRESGDTVEIVERSTAPGGFTVILADGQGSGRNAKTLSHFVTAKCLTLLKDGVRDGAVARAVSDQLYAYRHGQVSATLNLITADFTTRTLVITRNNPEPVYKYQVTSNKSEAEAGEEDANNASEAARQASEPEISNLKLETLNEASVPIGIYPRTRPVVQEFPLEAGLVVVAFSDGISQAGTRYEEKLDIEPALRQLISRQGTALQAQSIADALLELAINQDRRRPQDDMSVVVLTTRELQADDGDPLPRRLSIQVPFQ